MTTDALILYAALAVMPRHDKPGWWSQAPGGYESVEHTRAVSVGIGTVSGDYELRLTHTGAYSQAVAYTRDDANYDPASPTGCSGPCLPTTWGYNRQTNTAASALRYWGPIGVGVDVTRVDWRHVRHFSEDGDHAKRFTERYHTVDYVLGVRVAYRIGPFSVEYARDAKRLARNDGGVCCPPVKSVVSLGVIAPFNF